MTTICVPQKNGNRNFGGLVYAAYHQLAPFDYDDMKVSLSCFDHRMPMANCSRVYIIARNPFTRLLSYYRDIQVSGRCGSSCSELRARAAASSRRAVVGRLLLYSLTMDCTCDKLRRISNQSDVRMQPASVQHCSKQTDPSQACEPCIRSARRGRGTRRAPGRGR